MIKFAHLFREIKLKSNLQNYGNSIKLRTFEKKYICDIEKYL